MKDKEKIKISPDFKILDALKLMDKLMCKLLVVTEGKIYKCFKYWRYTKSNN